MIGIVALAAGLTLASAPPAGPLAPLDQSFVCPESLPEAARAQAIEEFAKAAWTAEPDLSLSRIILYRRTLLAKHDCQQTLHNLDRNEAQVRAGAVREQGWAPVLEKPTLQVYLSGSYVRPFDDPRLPGEQGIDTYLRVVSTVPFPLGGAPGGQYDEMVSHLVYFCGSHQLEEVEDDYFLAGKGMVRDAKPIRTAAGQTVYDLSTPPKDSLTDVAMAELCSYDRKGSE